MASDINRVFLIGRLTKDPELKYTQNGTPIASFTLANNKSFMQNNAKKDQCSFFNCIAWGKQGETIAQYCKKGKRIGIEGRLQQRSFDDQNGQKRSVVEIVEENFQFLDVRSEGENSGQHAAQPSQSPLGQKASASPAPSGGNMLSQGEEMPEGSVPDYSECAQHFSDDDIPF